MFKVIFTEPFLKDHFKFFDKTELRKFYLFKDRLKLNPYLGKGLRVEFVREFKTSKGKRAYFIVYEEFKIILFISCSSKKNQKHKIDEIFLRLREYYYFVKNHTS